MQKAILICLALAAVAGLLYILTRGGPGTPDPVADSSPAKSPGATPATAPGDPVSEFARTEPIPSNLPDAPPLAKHDGSVTLPRVDGKVYLNDPITLTREMHSEKSSSLDDVSAVGTALRYYQLVFKENPVGSLNEEIVAQLIGNNPKGIVVIAPDHPDINGKGELVDRWGTPYFFHGLTRTAMDVWSAGPDLKFGTLDDVKLGIDEEFGEALGLEIEN